MVCLIYSKDLLQSLNPYLAELVKYVVMARNLSATTAGAVPMEIASVIMTLFLSVVALIKRLALVNAWREMLEMTLTNPVLPPRRRRRDRANSTSDLNQTSHQQSHAPQDTTADSPPMREADAASTMALTLSPGSLTNQSSTNEFMTIPPYGRSYSPECRCHRLVECPGLLDDGSPSSDRKSVYSVSLVYWGNSFLVIFLFLFRSSHIMRTIHPRLCHLTLIQVEVPLLKLTKMTKSDRIQLQKSAASHILPSPVKYGGTRFCPSISRHRPSTFKPSPRLNDSLQHIVLLPIYASYSGHQIIGSHFFISRVSSVNCVIHLRGSKCNLVWFLHFLPYQHSGRALKVVNVPYHLGTKHKPRWTRVSTQGGLMRPSLKLLGYAIKYPLPLLYLLTS